MTSPQMGRENFFGEGGMRVSETMSPIRVINPKTMKNDKWREGVIKSEKWADVVYGWPLR